MKIDNLEFKYVARVHSLMDGYPSMRDLLFDIVETLHEQNATSDEFTLATVQALASYKAAPIKAADLLRTLVEEGYLLSRSTEKRDYYTLQNDPWE
jgi:hypothetical protein